MTKKWLKTCGKWRIYLGIGLSVWETAKIWEMAQICGKWRIWEMAKIMAAVFEKWLKYVGNEYMGDLIIYQTS